MYRDQLDLCINPLNLITFALDPHYVTGLHLKTKKSFFFKIELTFTF